MDTPLSKKMLIKPGSRVLVLNAPDGYSEKLEPLPQGAVRCSALDSTCNVVWLFVRNQAEIDHWFPRVFHQVSPGGILWVSYPKRTAPGVITDINRDTGWDAVVAAGWQGVTQIAVDETWSALRFRPKSEIKK